MPTQQTFVFDSRLPVSETTSKDDPNHPKNVCRNALLAMNQAKSDTKYDIVPPPRVEGFSFSFTHSFSFENEHKLGISFLCILIALGIVLYARSIAIRLVCIVVLLVSIHYACFILEKRTV
jgi:hypothetical protein